MMVMIMMVNGHDVGHDDYLGHDDGPCHPRLGVPLEVAHLGQQLRQVDLGPLLSSEQS